MGRNPPAWQLCDGSFTGWHAWEFTPAGADAAEHYVVHCHRCNAEPPPEQRAVMVADFERLAVATKLAARLHTAQKAATGTNVPKGKR